MIRVPKVSVKQLDTGKFQVNFTDPASGQRRRHQHESLGEAEVAKESIENSFRSGHVGHFSKMLVGELIRKHLEDRPDSKLMQRKNVFRAFNNHFGGVKLCHLTEEALRRWFHDMQTDNDFSPNNMLHIKSQLNHFFNYLVDKSYYQISPLSRIKFSRKTNGAHRVVLSKDEMRGLLAEANQFSPTVLYPYLYLLVHTGARRSEILGLKWQHVDFATGQIHFIETKNGEDRSIEISEKLKLLLKSIPKKSEFVLTNKQIGSLKPNSLQRLIEKLRKRHLLPKHWGSHSFRHSFAYHYLKQGGQMYQLQAILGHKSITMTVDLYGKITAADIENPSPFDF